MSKATRATQALEKAKIVFTVHTYDYDPDADKIGMQSAEALCEAPRRVLKTLMALVDGKPVCVILPSDREVSMKKLAAAFGGKSAQMTKPAEAERVSGFKVGGISPFGQMRALPTAIEAQAMAESVVYINGGQRGLQVRLSPRDAASVLKAIVAPLVARRGQRSLTHLFGCRAMKALTVARALSVSGPSSATHSFRDEACDVADAAKA